jgi:biotin synthase
MMIDSPPQSRWTLPAIKEIYSLPLLDLVFRAAQVHRAHHDPGEIQMCTLLSIKTGLCSEDCAYCPQSAHHQTTVRTEPLMDVDSVLSSAKKAKESGSTRFCMGAAWREVADGPQFDAVLEMVQGVRSLGLEACCTLGMLTQSQARRLADAGLSAYNHNLDTSPDYYDKIISTRTYQDRLDTIRHVSDAGISLCCGGILGMGESHEDRLKLLHVLSNLNPQPESVPINALVPVESTPLAERQPIETFDFIRVIATARVLMPQAMVRLSAGRLHLTPEGQAMAFLAGANSIFTGERLLTTPNPERSFDERLLETLKLKGRPAGKSDERRVTQAP